MPSPLRTRGISVTSTVLRFEHDVPIVGVIDPGVRAVVAAEPGMLSVNDLPVTAGRGLLVSG